MELPQELGEVKSVVHISMLKKYTGHPALIVPTENVGIKDNLSYEDIPVYIIDRQVRKLRKKKVMSVNDLRKNKFVEEVIREDEEDMKMRYPHLFEFGENVDQGTNSLLSTYLIRSKHVDICFLLLSIKIEVTIFS